MKRSVTTIIISIGFCCAVFSQNLPNDSIRLNINSVSLVNIIIAWPLILSTYRIFACYINKKLLHWIPSQQPQARSIGVGFDNKFYCSLFIFTI
jgi:hypothetical protein